MSPPRTVTIDDAPAVISDNSNVRLGLVLSLCGSLLATGVSYGVLRSQVADARAEQAEQRMRLSVLEQDKGDKAVQLQKLSDDVEHVRQTTDEMAQTLRELQRRGGH